MTSPPTKFAPPALATPQSVQEDHDKVASQKVLVAFLSAINSPVAVLNPERQIVWASDDFLRFGGLGSIATLLGRRPGEVLNCVHSGEEPGGCGTSESCAVCGAIDSVLESRRLNQRVVRECRLTVRAPQGGGSLDLETTATPWQFDGREFTVLTVRDIGTEKRRQSLERIFFHDIVNTAGGLAGLLEMLDQFPDLNQGKNLVGMSLRSSQDILEDIRSFQQLKLAEAGELVARPTDLTAARVVQEVADKVRYHAVAEGKLVEIESQAGLVRVRSDRGLLERVLVNMLKNALEASKPGALVTIGWREVNGAVVFWVHNPGLMPREVQLQVFQRSFSTKGVDRGLGTYSMRLIGESCLGGKVAFTSGEAGTEFTLTLT